MNNHSVATKLRPSECDYEYVPRCPYCSAREIDVDEYGLRQDGDEAAIVCGKCDKHYKVKVWIPVPRYSTEPNEGWDNVVKPAEPHEDIPF